LEQER
jgi:hypothetical protein